MGYESNISIGLPEELLFLFFEQRRLNTVEIHQSSKPQAAAEPQERQVPGVPPAVQTDVAAVKVGAQVYELSPRQYRSACTQENAERAATGK